MFHTSIDNLPLPPSVKPDISKPPSMPPEQRPLFLIDTAITSTDNPEFLTNLQKIHQQLSDFPDETILQINGLNTPEAIKQNIADIDIVVFPRDSKDILNLYSMRHGHLSVSGATDLPLHNLAAALSSVDSIPESGVDILTPLRNTDPNPSTIHSLHFSP